MCRVTPSHTYVRLVYSVDTIQYIVGRCMYANRACPEVYKPSAVHAPIVQVSSPSTSKHRIVSYLHIQVSCRVCSNKVLLLPMPAQHCPILFSTPTLYIFTSRILARSHGRTCSSHALHSFSCSQISRHTRFTTHHFPSTTNELVSHLDLCFIGST